MKEWKRSNGWKSCQKATAHVKEKIILTLSKMARKTSFTTSATGVKTIAIKERDRVQFQTQQNQLGI